MTERAVKVINLDGVEKVVGGIKWNTTVEELICKLHQPKEAKNLLLVEVWRGCSRVVPRTKRVSSILGEWGYIPEHEDMVKLMVVKRTEFFPNFTTKRQMKRRKYRSGKIATRKRMHAYHSNKYKTGQSKRATLHHMLQLIKQLEVQREAVDNLLTPHVPNKVPDAIEDVKSLPADQQQEGQALLEAIAEERKEKEDLIRRKEELSDKILAQEEELGETKEAVSSLEAKVLNEQHKLNNLLEVKNPPEIEYILKETARVKNELKVRTKLNRLQSTKMQELTSTVLQVEEELKQCQQEIEMLKLSTSL